MILAVVLVAVGCSSKEPKIPYENIDVTAPRKASSASSAFDAYTRLAKRAEKSSIVGLDARDTRGNRSKEIRAMRPILDDLSIAVRGPCQFGYATIAPFEQAPYRGGWLRIGRALKWQIEDLVDKDRLLEACRWAIVATKFGFDLCGGTMSDATLGFEIANDARAAVAGSLGALSSQELLEIGGSIRAALDRLPEARTTIEHEGLQMLAAVKLIQDAHREAKLEALSKQFYGKSRKAIEALETFDDQQRSEFFKSLLEEQKNVVTQLLEVAYEPGATRREITSSLSGEEKAIAENFFYTGMAWMRARDHCIARTRLFALTSFVAAAAKSTGTAPESVASYGVSLDSDPFTGRNIGYISLGRDFILYSFGEDGKDDRGDTDSDRRSPDLRLEDAPL